MSGSTIGGALGFLVGTAFGAPQLGFILGSLIGGVVAPEKIKGPRLSDAQQQTASDGVPRTRGDGTFTTTGNLIWVDPTVKEHKQEEGGKGGPKQITYTYTRSSAIAVCKGPIAGYRIIKRNGKIVYDTRSNAILSALGYTSDQIAEQRAAQAKFLEVATLYLGDEDQNPDPTITAVKGSGNVPAYRGTAYIVLTDDETNQGEVAQFEFVVAACGSSTTVTEGGVILITGSGVGGTPTPFITAAAVAEPTFVGIPTATGANLDNAPCSVNSAGEFIAVAQTAILYSNDIENSWQSVSTSYAAGRGRFGVYGSDGWLLQYTAESHAGPLASASSVPTDATDITITISGVGTRASLSWINYVSGYYWGCVGFGGASLLVRCATIDGTWEVVCTESGSITSGTDSVRFFYDIREFQGALYACCYTASTFGGLGGGDCLRKSTDGGTTWDVLLVDGRSSATIDPFQMTVSGEVLIVVNRDCSKVWTSEDNFASAHSTGVSRSTADLPRNENEGRFVASAAGLAFIMGDSQCVSTADGLTFNTPVSYPSSFGLPIAIAAYGTTFSGTAIPDAPGYYLDPVTGQIVGPDGTVVDPCDLTLGEIVASECAERNVTDIDVSDLTDEVLGFRVSGETSPQQTIQSLQSGFFFDGSEYDGVLHFPKRGGDETFDLTMDDLVARDGDPIEWTRVQEAELLRKVTVGYIDPDTTYEQTTQSWERRTGTIRALGEGTLELPVTQGKDWAKQAAEKSLKVAWAETDSCKFSVSIAQAALVPAQVGTLTDSEGVVHRIRITRIEDDGGVRMIEAVRERANTYVSNAVGTSTQPPSYPGSPLRGPTIGPVMNLPVLRDADDKAGIYWAGCGSLSGWLGAILQLSRDGGTTWETGPTITQPATIGLLTADLPSASRYALDTVNTLSVQLYPSASDLSSTTYTGLMEEKNAAAIVYPDGRAEIVQFQTATQTDTLAYDLTNLMRGRNDTTAAAHSEGALFVLLDDAVRFVAIKPEDLGQTLTFRAVSIGTDPDANATQSITMTTIESLREWQPYNVVVESDGSDGYCVSWIGRARLGTSRIPVHSQWFIGYRVTFTIGATVYEVDTTAQSLCVDAATMAEQFGSGYGYPDVTVRARSRVATNDDDFDSDPAGESDPPQGYPYTSAGNLPDGYVGEPYYLPTDYTAVAPRVFTAYGGLYEQTLLGEVATNVWGQGTGPANAYITGVPLVAATADSDLTLTASGPLTVGDDPIDIVQSVTIAAKPTYGMMDWRRAGRSVYLVETTPPWTTAYAVGSLRARAGFDSGKVRAEFTVDGLGVGESVLIGVSAAPDNSNLSTIAAGHYVFEVTTDGTYAVEVDATGSPSDVEVLDGGGSLDTATLSDALSFDGLFRFAWSAPTALPGVTIKVNMGNESWVVTPSSGFAGVPNTDMVVPVGWDVGVGLANGYVNGGDLSQTIELTNHGSLVYAYDAFGKSSGTWRVGMACATDGVARIGLCKDGHTGLLGRGADSFGLYFDFQPGDAQIVIEASFGGSESTLRIPHPYYTMDRKLILVCDFDAHTVEIWGKPQFSDYILLVTLAGLPTGTWVPAGNYTVELINDASDVPGADDWTLTL